MTKAKQKSRMVSFLTIVLLVFSINARAQFAPSIVDTGTVIPNVLLTDINGNKNNLYRYLDSGYTVVIKLFLTTCSICWSFHQQGVFEGIYQKYGPNGSVVPRKILPIEIEMNTSTTSEDLNGTGRQTQGDWVTGVNYPIIDLNRRNEREVMDAFLDSGFNIINTPTFMVICPDRKLVYSGEGGSSLTEQLAVQLMEGRCAKGKPTGMSQVITQTSVSLYPNPARDILNINLEALSAANAKFVITNLLGQTFVKEQVHLEDGEHTTALNIQELLSGIYILTITTDQEIIQQPFVVKQ